jgi:hypothetical protein
VSSREPIKFGSGAPPADLIDKSRLKHTERRIISPIDIALWDRAKWCGTVFGTAEGTPPLLGITFENGQVGQAIFRAWRDRWGKEDVDDALRVAIITGLSSQNPAHYAVMIGPNLNKLMDSCGQAITTVSRINRMQPASPTNLDRFLDAYREFGGYILCPAQMGSPPIFLHSIYLAKRHLEIRQAWQICENDPDAMALQDDDDPIIPSTVQDPPVRKALEQMRAFRQRSRRGN